MSLPCLGKVKLLRLIHRNSCFHLFDSMLPCFSNLSYIISGPASRSMFFCCSQSWSLRNFLLLHSSLNLFFNKSNCCFLSSKASHQVSLVTEKKIEKNALQIVFDVLIYGCFCLLWETILFSVLSYCWLFIYDICWWKTLLYQSSRICRVKIVVIFL